ncbi:ABC transporter ATP-binding protein [Spirochaeta thermophila]|nr:ABC transporter ATP-binding protein [Spirochaeta thermophila]
MGNEYVLEGVDLTRYFGIGRRRFAAVDHVNIGFREGEIVSIVGESGSGKTTLAKIFLGLLRPSSGEVRYRGEVLRLRGQRERRAYWSEVQAIFQDPFASFNQFFRVDRFLQDCLKVAGIQASEQEARRIKEEACSFVNLPYHEIYNKYPFELSGGQMQRLMIARVFIIKPRVLIADEPTSMIDACSRSTILDMLLSLRKERGTTIVFITHDLGLAYYVSDRIAIMHRGKICEEGDAKRVIEAPRHEYTKSLLADVPRLMAEWSLE